MNRELLGLVALAVAVLPWAVAGAQSYVVEGSDPLIVAPPVAQEAPVVYVRSGDDPWQPAEFRAEDGRIMLSLDPAILHAGRALLLVNPSPGVDINDTAAPTLTALAVDGVARKVDPRVDLGAVGRAPEKLALEVEDAGNELDAGSVRVQVDGQRLLGGLYVAAPRPRALVIAAQLRPMETGTHTVRYQVQDTSPQANVLSGEVTFAYHDLTNLVLAAHGTRLTCDSCFPGYDSLPVLQDGVTKTAPATLPPETTWASAETPEPHWVQVDFGQPRTISQVKLFWANYVHQFHSSRHVQVEIPQGDGWRAVYVSPPEGEPDTWVTTASFAPIEVSRFRVWQPAGQGSPKRPNLMWLVEIEAR